MLSGFFCFDATTYQKKKLISNFPKPCYFFYF